MPPPAGPEPPAGSPPVPSPGESLAERVRRAGPLGAAAALALARQLLVALEPSHRQGRAHGGVDPANLRFAADAPDGESLTLPDAAPPAPDPDPDATREDLHRLGAAVWFALTGSPPESPLPWERLDGAGITPALGALPVLFARTLTGDPAQRPRTASALLEALNVLASLGASVPSLPSMPSPAPGSGFATTPQPPPTGGEEGELWTRPAVQRPTPNRRRRPTRRAWVPLLTFALGAAVGFAGGLIYERTPRPAPAASPVVVAGPPDAALPVPAPSPDLAWAALPEQPATTAAAQARLERVKILQPDVGDVLRYARELRRVATVSVNDAATFPAEVVVARVLERFDWRNPASPYFHRTPLLLVLGYADDTPDAQGQALSQHCADALAQALVGSGITSPVYPVGLGSGDATPEVERPAAGGGPFLEVWVAWTLF